METDDEARWLVALISDTGMRLSEAAGLSKEDIHLDADIPYVEIRPHIHNTHTPPMAHAQGGSHDV